MSKSARTELSKAIGRDYRKASWKEKGKLLDAFVAATGYSRKHAVRVLNMRASNVTRLKPQREHVYGTDVFIALKKVWLASNRLCSKRLVPFLPRLIDSMVRFGHLEIEDSTKEQLLEISAATVDRLLKAERKKYGKSKSTTKPGRLLKTQIPIRTFADWNDAQPGFLEADCVAHCGPVAKGAFLNTLTVTDICTGWTELFALLNKADSAVATALSEAVRLLPFPIQGLDTDNGTEFINSSLIKWCSLRKVSFTRSRAYKKNDQAHVEEKNGSIVRRYVGYDRFEGKHSLEKLQALYLLVRQYVNYFQPSMKLLIKEREGGRVTKRYDAARTPAERILSSQLPAKIKNRVKAEMSKLDPVDLLAQIQKRQLGLWHTAAQIDPKIIAQTSLLEVLESTDPLSAETVLVKLDQRRREIKEKRKNRSEPATVLRLRPDIGITQGIREQLDVLPEGTIFRTKQIQHLGSRAAVDQALCRLMKERRIRRIGCGRYASWSATTV